MMKQYSASCYLVLVWLLSLASPFLFSCSKDDNSESIPSKQVALSVSLAGISESDETTEITRGDNNIPSTQTVTVPAGNGMSLEVTLQLSAPVTTRGVTALAADVKYRVIVFKQNDVSSSGYISYADYAVGTTSAIGGELHAPSGTTSTFVFYSLGTTALPAFNQSSLDVAANPATDDLLYAKFNQTITTETHSVSFTLKHQFSLVTVIADASVMSQDISAINCSLSPNYSGTLNLGTGLLTAGTSAPRSIPWGTITAGQTVTASPCTVFTNASSAITVSIPSVTIGGVTKTNFIATFGANTMQSGYKYVLRLKFKTHEGPVVANLTWAPGNLIGTSDGSGGWIYTFAASQEYYSGVWNGGDYWGWCQLDPTNYTSSAAAYNYANDPCRLVDPVGTWRIPTQAEFQNLINTGSVWATKNGKNGRYFGTTTIPIAGTEDSYMFLPTAGYRSPGSMSMSYAGTPGNYWSTTIYNATDAYKLDIYNPNATIGFSNRRLGIPIRCVK